MTKARRALRRSEKNFLAKERRVYRLGYTLSSMDFSVANARRKLQITDTGFCSTHYLSLKGDALYRSTSEKCTGIPNCALVRHSVQVPSFSQRDKKTHPLKLQEQFSLLQSQVRQKRGVPWSFDRLFPTTSGERRKICKRNRWFKLKQSPGLEGQYKVLPNRLSLEWFNKQFYTYYEVQGLLSLLFVNAHVKIKDLMDVRNIVLRFLGTGVSHELSTLQRRLLNSLHYHIRRIGNDTSVSGDSPNTEGKWKPNTI